MTLPGEFDLHIIDTCNLHCTECIVLDYLGDNRVTNQKYNLNDVKEVVSNFKRLDLRVEELKILDIGCGKGFILYEFKKLLLNCEVKGLDISSYAIKNAKNEVKNDLIVGNANHLPFEKDYFDLVISLNTLHNLYCYDMKKALSEIERVGKSKKYICIESYRNEFEKMNLLYWQVTCECFFTPKEWKWWFDLTDYKGAHSFIYFE